MTVKYSYATQILVEQIAHSVYGKDCWEHGNSERGFGPIKNSPVALIPCEYHGALAKRLPSGHYPAGNMYPDKSWEGARARNSGGRQVLEYFGGFNVIKDTLGRCLIPDTPNNIARLDAMKDGKKQVLRTEKFTAADGTTRTRRVRAWVSVPPLYTRIEGEGISGDLSTIIANEVKKALAARDNPLPPDEEYPVEQAAVPAPAGVIDIPREPAAPVASVPRQEIGQPAAPATGGESGATPPAEPPQPTPVKRNRPAAPAAPVLAPVSKAEEAAIAAAVAVGDEF